MYALSKKNLVIFCISLLFKILLCTIYISVLFALIQLSCNNIWIFLAVLLEVLPAGHIQNYIFRFSFVFFPCLKFQT